MLRDRLAFEVERSKRSSEGFAVLFLDLDRFKDVNDRYGHEAGNDVLRAVARRDPGGGPRLRRGGAVRRRRVRGDPDPDRPATGGARVAEALRAGIEGVGRRLGYPPALVTVSIGLAEFDPAHAVGGRPAGRAPTGRCTGPRRRAGTRSHRPGRTDRATEGHSIVTGFGPRPGPTERSGPATAGPIPPASGGVPDPWGVRRAENLLTSLEGILSARVVTTPLGEVSEVHILAQAGLAPKQLVRNIESRAPGAARAQGGPSEDQHRADGGREADRGAGAATRCGTGCSSGRCCSRTLSVAPGQRPHRITMQVTLTLPGADRDGGGGGVGHAAEPGGGGGPGHGDGAGPAADRVVDGARGGQDRGGASTGSSCSWRCRGWAGGRRSLMTGTAEIKESAERAAVFAVLDATNRWTEARRPG